MNTGRMFALYDTMPLERLADRLEELDCDRPVDGWSARDATHWISVERRIVEHVTGGGSRGAIECNLELHMIAHYRFGPALLVAVEDGGVVVRSEGRWRPGTLVELRIGDGPRVRGSVAGTIDDRVRIRFLRCRSEYEERRLHRFVRQALRHRTAWHAAL